LPSNNFSKLVLAAVDESLSSLGDSSKEAIFFHLEASFKLKRENIPTDLTQFSRALEGILGPGASYLEQLIARRLHEKLGLKFEERDHLDFSECVGNMKRRILFEGECTTR
jgi:hypothetical protein